MYKQNCTLTIFPTIFIPRHLSFASKAVTLQRQTKNNITYMTIFRFPPLRHAIKIWAVIVASWLAASLLLASCGNEDSTNVNDINKQTVLVFMPWTGNNAKDQGLYSNFQQNLDSIEHAIVANKGYTGRLVVFLSTSAQTSSLYEVTYKSGTISHTILKTYDGTDYTTASGISQIMSDVKASAYALNYAMIVGGHGCGWTYAADWDTATATAKTRRATQGSPTTYPQTRFFGSSAPSTYSIDVETLAEGISQAGVKLQYLLFDNCYMANVETAYALRDATNWLVASTSEVMAIGMPYASMWQYLGSSTPSYRSMVSSFHSFYASYSTPCGTLSAIDCRQMEALAALMLNINSRYTLPDSLIDSLQVLDGFHTPLFYDLGDYVNHVCSNASLLSDFDSQLKRTVPYFTTTDTLYSNLYDHPAYIAVKNFSGLTISDPSRNSVATKGKQKTAWWKATHSGD